LGGCRAARHHLVPSTQWARGVAVPFRSAGYGASTVQAAQLGMQSPYRGKAAGRAGARRGATIRCSSACSSYRTSTYSFLGDGFLDSLILSCLFWGAAQGPPGRDAMPSAPACLLAFLSSSLSFPTPRVWLILFGGWMHLLAPGRLRLARPVCRGPHRRSASPLCRGCWTTGPSIVTLSFHGHGCLWFGSRAFSFRHLLLSLDLFSYSDSLYKNQKSRVRHQYAR